MTATCTLCGAIIQVPHDLRGSPRTLGQLGGAFTAHIKEKHASEPQTAFNPEEIKCPLLGLFQPQFAPVMGMTLQGAILFSYLNSTDPAFLEQSEKVRAIILAAIEQKVAPAIDTSAPTLAS